IKNREHLQGFLKIGFAVSDVDALAAELKHLGAKLISEPRNDKPLTEGLCGFHFLAHTSQWTASKSVQGERNKSVLQEFLSALPSPERAPELPEVDDIFGWMIGSWEMDAILHDRNGQH